MIKNFSRPRSRFSNCGWLADARRRMLRHDAATACVLVFLLGEEGEKTSSGESRSLSRLIPVGSPLAYIGNASRTIASGG